MGLDRLTVGFIPLVDAAIPIVAAEAGFAADEGLEIALVREVSWSNIRDRLTLGHFDAAHLLAPLAIATTLGLNALKAPLAVPMALGLNGNAVTLAPRFYDELISHLAADADVADPKATGEAFASLVAARRACGDEPPTLGMTFPFSTHNYQLRLWLAAAGVDPDRDVRLAVVPPPFMVDALENGHVAGFCVGAPWNSIAVELGIGRILHFGVDLVRNCPEKVLAVRAEWLDGSPDLAARLVRASIRAAAWIDDPANRPEAAAMLAASDRLDVPAETVLRVLQGRLLVGGRPKLREATDYMTFAPGEATRPDPRHAAWLHEQMSRWGQTNGATASAAENVYRTEFYDGVAGAAA